MKGTMFWMAAAVLAAGVGLSGLASANMAAQVSAPSWTMASMVAAGGCKNPHCVKPSGKTGSKADPKAPSGGQPGCCQPGCCH